MFPEPQERKGRVDADVLSVAEHTHSLTLSTKQLGAFALACILCNKKLLRPRLRAVVFSATLHFCCYGRHAVILFPIYVCSPAHDYSFRLGTVSPF